jgi:hypothetical protein
MDTVVHLPRETRHTLVVIDRCEWRIRRFVKVDAYVVYDYWITTRGLPPDVVEGSLACDQQRHARPRQVEPWESFLDMEVLVKGMGRRRSRSQRIATVITLIFAGQQSRCRMTVSRHRAVLALGLLGSPLPKQCGKSQRVDRSSAGRAGVGVELEVCQRRVRE